MRQKIYAVVGLTLVLFGAVMAMEGIRGMDQVIGALCRENDVIIRENNLYRKMAFSVKTEPTMAPAIIEMSKLPNGSYEKLPSKEKNLALVLKTGAPLGENKFFVYTDEKIPDRFFVLNIDQK